MLETVKTRELPPGCTYTRTTSAIWAWVCSSRSTT